MAKPDFPDPARRSCPLALEDAPLYDVVLTGRIQADHRHDEVVRAVARIYRIPANQVAQSFAKGPRIVKRAAGARKAERYVRKLRRTGAEVVLLPARLPSQPMMGGDQSGGPAPAGLAGPCPPTANRGRRRWLLPAALAALALVLLGAYGLLSHGPSQQIEAPLLAEANPAEPADETTGAPMVAAEADEPIASEPPAGTDQSPSTPIDQPEAEPPPTVATVPAAPFATSAAPFGLAPDADVEALMPAANASTDMPAVRVPSPDPGFADYRARLSDQGRPAILIAVGEPIRTSADGRALRKVFDDLEARLKAIYGDPVRQAIQFSRSAYDGDDQWMQALAAGERILVSTWTRADAADLPPELARICCAPRHRPPPSGGCGLRSPTPTHPNDPAYPWTRHDAAARL